MNGFLSERGAMMALIALLSVYVLLRCTGCSFDPSGTFDSDKLFEPCSTKVTDQDVDACTKLSLALDAKKGPPRVGARRQCPVRNVCGQTYYVQLSFEREGGWVWVP